MDLKPNQHVFFAGIGGISMSGLAHALLKLGYTVSGSDIGEGETVQRLRQDGVTVHKGHRAENIAGADVVIRTTAVPADSPEILAAEQAGIPIYHRSELLAWMCRDKHAIAVTGTHGKSTTTAMIARTLIGMGEDPTVFVGAEMPSIGGNWRLGGGPFIVFEACESDRSFLHYENCSEVITSCEPDHLDQHKTFEALVETFVQFAQIGDPEGFVVYDSDYPQVSAIAENAPGRKVAFSGDGPEGFHPRNVRLQASGTDFDLFVGDEFIAPVHLRPIGRHNVLNALAALAAIDASGLDLKQACKAIEGYQPIGRRFQEIGRLDEVLVVDDYAHHPTELKATLAAARETHGGRIIAIFQPHLRSRTRDLLPEFSTAFADADMVILTDIYQARDDGLSEFDVTDLLNEVRRNEPGKPVELVRDMHQVPEYLRPRLQPGDLVLTIGAGDIYRVAYELVGASK